MDSINSDLWMLVLTWKVVFVLMLQENGSIRSDEGSNGENKIDACKDEACSSSSSAGTMKRKMSRKTKVSHHWLPSIHEDYYGPRRHKARHH